jgi:hypothetical protein
MGRTKSYTVAGRHFATQRDLDAAIKEALNSHPRDTPFEDTFLAAVINELHPEVRAARQRVTAFQYLSYGEQLRRGLATAQQFRGGNIMLGWFEPADEWTDVTVYPHRKPTDPRRLFHMALRAKIAPHLPHPGADDRCAEAGCTASGVQLEYEHAEPTFLAIASACMEVFTEEEIAGRFGHNKFLPGKRNLVDCIPDVHPAIARLRELHQDNRWMWLCKLHHRNVGGTGERPRAAP